MIGKYQLWIIYLLGKIFYGFFALIVVGSVVQLGDSESYLSGEHFNLQKAFFNSTSFVGTFGYSLNFIFGSHITNIVFIIISFYGIYYPLSRLKLTLKQLATILLYASIPSFGVWSSLPSKEVFVILGMGLYLGWIFDRVNKNNGSKLALMLGLYFVILIKPLYMVPILLASAATYLVCKTKYKNSAAIASLIISVVLISIIFYVFRDFINLFAEILPLHFDPRGGTTRIDWYFSEENEIFASLPFGAFISFFGPTLNEMQSSVFLMYVFVESLLLVSIFVITLLYTTIKGLASLRVSIFGPIIFFIFLFSILIVHYPFGYLNPGSAVRYRSSFYPFVVIIYCVSINLRLLYKNKAIK